MSSLMPNMIAKTISPFGTRLPPNNDRLQNHH
jgi:hypothetical protein